MLRVLTLMFAILPLSASIGDTLASCRPDAADILFASAAPIPPAKDAAELTALLNTFLAGASRNDAAVHDRFWAEDLIYTRSAGQRIGKADIMRDVREAPVPGPAEPVTIYSAEEIRIQQYGDTALVAFRLIGKTTRDGNTDVASFLNTGTFLKRNGEWRAVGWQATRVPRTAEEVVRQVTAVEAALQKASFASDIKTLGSLLDESFTWTLSTGEVMTRQQLLDLLGSGRLKYSKLETNSITISPYGDAAVARGVTTRQRSAIPGSDGKGDPAPFTADYTITFVNKGGSWMAVAMHSSRPADK